MLVAFITELSEHHELLKIYYWLADSYNPLPIIFKLEV